MTNKNKTDRYTEAAIVFKDSLAQIFETYARLKSNGDVQKYNEIIKEIDNEFDRRINDLAQIFTKSK